MRVVEAKVCYPINARGGLYILLEGTREEMHNGESDRLAIQTANENGWNGDGKATIGMESRKGVHIYTRAYWFYEKRT